jgi:hypothetical protein
MCSAIFFRITESGWISTRSPGALGALGAMGFDSMYSRMSCFVTRPPMPVPGIPEMSTLCSRAMRRTSGDDFWRRRSSLPSGRAAPWPFGFDGLWDVEALVISGADAGAEEPSP